MTKAPSPPEEVFLSGPFEPDELQRLLTLIDERLRARSEQPASPGRASGSDGEAATHGGTFFDPMTTVTGEALRSLAAPLFNRDRGGRLARGAKVLLNLPLRLFGGPQAYFNDALRTIISSWSQLLTLLLDGHAVLEHELAEQRRRLDELAARVEELRRALERPAPPPASSSPGGPAA